MDWRAEWAKIWLEYLRVLLSAPTLGAACAILFAWRFAPEIRGFMRRADALRFPGGELKASQKVRDELVQEAGSHAPSEPPIPPGPVQTDDPKRLEKAVTATRETALFWEYKYLNLYLAQSTQIVLDWLVKRAEQGNPVSLHFFDAELSRYINNPDERSAIFSALRTHYLVNLDTAAGLIEITPKGREYHAWRGPLPTPALPIGRPISTEQPSTAPEADRG